MAFKTYKEVGIEARKQCQLLWYIDWFEWQKRHPTQTLADDQYQNDYLPAMLFADTLDHHLKEEYSTKLLDKATINDRAKILGQVTALAWVLGMDLPGLGGYCGPGKGKPLPPLPD
jgi:hypothetical protein